MVQNHNKSFSVIQSCHCKQPCSAVLAELRALIAARQEGIGNYVYTGSVYAHSVCHLFGVLWTMRRFKKTNWFHMLYNDQIVELMLALVKI